jgi:hypothetical protein
MAGCYKCGLPDGSAERLCETCFARRFDCCGSIPESSDLPATGFEITPRLQRWLLSSGAVLYIGVVSLGIVVQAERAEARDTSITREFLKLGGNDNPVIHSKEFGFIAGPSGEMKR